MDETISSRAGWENAPGIAEHTLILGYGASRNLVRNYETSFLSKSAELRRLNSLFEPFSPFASMAMFFKNGEDVGPNFYAVFQSVLEDLLGSELTMQFGESALEFDLKTGSIAVEELPDGYRSTIAWVSDLCWNWAQQHPESNRASEIDAIVLIDEIDLHLHPQLQRVLVPRLRKIFPKVQWIVTTHSPLVLSCFDKNEIVLLDKDSPGGVEVVDRQLFGLSADQVMVRVMDANPSGTAIEERLREAEKDPSLRESVTNLLESQSEEIPLLSAQQVGEMMRKFKR